MKLLDRDEHDRYTNTPETAHYLDRGRSEYIGDLFDFRSARQYGPWGGLSEALRTGKPQSGVRGSGNFGAYYADAAVRDNVAKGMTAGVHAVTGMIAAKFPWHAYRTFFDVGTAQGGLPVAVARAHPHLTGGGFDLPAVGALFDDYVTEHGLVDRLPFVAGDFFVDPFPQADVLILGRVLHNWNLRTKAMLLTKAYDALPKGGALIVYEALIDDARRENAQALLASLNMLVISRRVRFLRRRLRRLDDERRIPRHAGRAADRGARDGRRNQMIALIGCGRYFDHDVCPSGRVLMQARS